VAASSAISEFMREMLMGRDAVAGICPMGLHVRRCVHLGAHASYVTWHGSVPLPPSQARDRLTQKTALCGPLGAATWQAASPSGAAGTAPAGVGLRALQARTLRKARTPRPGRQKGR
jgi:hypothetical protein